MNCGSGPSPIEVAAVDDHAADGGAVAAENFVVLCVTMLPPIERPAEVGRGGGVVDHDRDGELPAQGCDFFERKDGESGLPSVSPYRFWCGSDRLSTRSVGRIDERRSIPGAGRCTRLIVGATGTPAARDDLIAHGAQREDHQDLRRVAARRGRRAHAASSLARRCSGTSVVGFMIRV